MIFLIDDLILTGDHGILVDDLGAFKLENNKRFGGITPLIDNKFILLYSISDNFEKISEFKEFLCY